MPLHPTAEMMIKVLHDTGLTFTPETTPEDRRAAMIAATTNPAFPKHPVHDVGNRTIPGPGGSIPVRVYRPSAHDALPLLMWFHGGGWVTGNLAAVVALCARDAGLPQPKLQLLVYPVTDYEFESPAMIENAKGYFLELESMRWFYDHYAGTRADFDEWRFSPMRAPDVAGVAPAVVITAEFDPLRDQGEAYGRRLQQAGVPTDIVRAEGLIHGFFGMHAFMPPGQHAWDVSVRALRDALDLS